MILKSLILVAALLAELSSNSQDTLFVRQFDSLIDTHYLKMKMTHELKDSLSLEEAIILIKLENTISREIFKVKKKKYICFDSYFVVNYVQKVIEKIG